MDIIQKETNDWIAYVRTSRKQDALANRMGAGGLGITYEPLMQFGYTIIYTADVEKSVAFFEDAFGIKRRFVHESGYGELETGSTALAFAHHDLGKKNLTDGYISVDEGKPLGIEIALVSNEVSDAYDRAINAGATPISSPTTKPWGQIVAYVRCPDGTLVEICSPVAT
jgi:catechol 2,3-dioxygenase-like lactoylglutathione lyase family enzyme